MFAEYKNVSINIYTKEQILKQILNFYHNVYVLGKSFFDNIPDTDTKFALNIYLNIYH